MQTRTQISTPIEERYRACVIPCWKQSLVTNPNRVMSMPKGVIGTMYQLLHQLFSDPHGPIGQKRVRDDLVSLSRGNVDSPTRQPHYSQRLHQNPLANSLHVLNCFDIASATGILIATHGRLSNRVSALALRDLLPSASVRTQGLPFLTLTSRGICHRSHCLP